MYKQILYIFIMLAKGYFMASHSALRRLFTAAIFSSILCNPGLIHAEFEDLELTFDVEETPASAAPSTLQSKQEQKQEALLESDAMPKPVHQNIKERTLALIKPDGVKSLKTGSIVSVIELNKFTIVDIKKIKLAQEQAEEFYAEHKGKPFFDELVEYMTSGPIMALMLEKENAIKDWRKLMGSTNPADADPGTIRKMFGTNKTFNVVHGSDSPESAQREIGFFFEKL